MSEVLTDHFADQLCVSMFEMFVRRGFSVHTMTVQFRATEGLEELYNKLFYQGKIVNGKDTCLKERRGFNRAIQWMNESLRNDAGENFTSPYVFVHVPNGVCLRDEETQSRFNLQNIDVGVSLIRELIEKKIWKEDDIIVATTCKQQRQCWADALIKNGHYIPVHTIDGVQSAQRKCVALDLVLAAD